MPGLLHLIAHIGPLYCATDCATVKTSSSVGGGERGGDCGNDDNVWYSCGIISNGYAQIVSVCVESYGDDRVSMCICSS